MEIKKEIYISASGSLLVIVFLSLFFVFPLISEITKTSKEMSLEISDRLLLKDQYSEAGNFKQKYESYQTSLDKIDNMFVDAKNPVAFIEFLEKTASDLGIKLQISAPSLINEGALSYSKFQLSANGGFSNTLKFLKQIEAGEYLIKIQNLSITNNESAKQATQTGANITIKALSK
jgi:hypothetical protein